MPPSMVTGPPLTLALAGTSQTIPVAFTGMNLQPGDRAKWVHSDATSCESTFDFSRASTIETDGGGVSGALRCAHAMSDQELHTFGCYCSRRHEC